MPTHQIIYNGRITDMHVIDIQRKLRSIRPDINACFLLTISTSDQRWVKGNRTRTDRKQPRRQLSRRTDDLFTPHGRST